MVVETGRDASRRACAPAHLELREAVYEARMTRKRIRCGSRRETRDTDDETHMVPDARKGAARTETEVFGFWEVVGGEREA